MRKWLSLVPASSMLLLLLVAAPTVSADSRCSGGYGMQGWQDSGQSGVSFIRCSSGGDIGTLTSVNDNLVIGDWNDRISSWQTFNAGTKKTCLFENAGYGYSNATHNSRITGNNTISSMGAANDRPSSIDFNTTTAACPIS